MKEYSIPMAVFDLLPVVFFIAGTMTIAGDMKQKMALVGMMVAGLAALDASLCFLAAKLKKRKALVLFIISFFLCLGMGYLSSKSFEKASMNWIAEGINAVGQLAFLAGCGILHEAGLDKL